MDDHTPDRKARARQGPISTTAAVTLNKPVKNTKYQPCLEEEAYDFFCHDPDKPKQKKTLTASSSQETGGDTVIDIGPSEVVIHDVNITQNLFVPSDFPVLPMRTVPGNLKPRFLEDEGLHVRERPQVPWNMMNKMENRLIEQEKGQHWFGENGRIIALPEPIQKYWRCKVDFPFPSQSPLTTVYMGPVTPGASVTSSEGMWQLDLNLVALVFTHHPLFSTEHVLTQCLLDLYEHYQTREMARATASLQDKLRWLKKSKTALTTVDETTSSKMRKLREEIRKTAAVLNKERQLDVALVRKIVTTWNRIKALRTKNGFVSTTVKLQMHRVKPKDTDRSANVTEGDDHREDTHVQVEDPANQRLEHFDLIPVLTMSDVVTPTLRCPPHEKCRRYELDHHRISVKIFYNGKHVSTSEQAAFDNDFRVDIQQMFNMQIVHSPQNILLKICESAKGKSTVVDKLYVPIPDRNMLSSIAALERTEFSSNQVVRPYYEGVGSNVPFKLDEEEAQVYVRTSGRLLYTVSWAVDDTGLPMAPAVSPDKSSFTRALTSHGNGSRPQGIRDPQFDPNHPANTERAELLREACEQRDIAGSYFRLRALEEEFDFTTEDQLEKSRRFRLLRLRNTRTVNARPSKAVPLHDRDITEDMFAEYTGSSSPPCVHEDPITSQRSYSLYYIEKLLNLARKKLSNFKKLSDMVKEVQYPDRAREVGLGMVIWGMLSRAWPLNPKRVARETTPAPRPLSDGDLKIHICVNNAWGLPVRQEAHIKEMHARDSRCGLGGSRHNMQRSTQNLVSQAGVQPFFEVRFQETTYESSVEQGHSPCWREEFTLDFKSIDGDYSHAGLSKIQDSIVINVFDEISFQVIESSSFGGCGSRVFSGRQWLGSVTIPFRILLQQSKVCERLSICNPVVLLGYTWTDEGFVNDEGTDIQLGRDHGSLDVFITLDPNVSLTQDLTPKDVQDEQLWQFPTDEEESLLNLTCEFERQSRAADGGRRRRCVVTMVVNSEGRLVLATRFFEPLPPPQEVLQGSLISVLERVAAFVSLIPALSVSSEVGDCGDMWFTSKECLELVMANRVSLAVLLCNFFCHLRYEAWLVLGTSVSEGDTSYVLTRAGAWNYLWNPRDGKHYRPDAFCPLHSVDCLVNGENVWFNSQLSKKTDIINFDVTDIDSWTPLFRNGFGSDTTSVPLQIMYRPPNMDLVSCLQRRMEVKLKSCVMDWRIPHPTRWNNHCSAKLSQVLRLLEKSPVPFSDIETEVELLLVSMPDYKVTGFPIHLAFQDMESVVEAVYNTRIHSTENPGTVFALGIYICPYPNHILSVWIFLATLVKHQHQSSKLPQ